MIKHIWSVLCQKTIVDSDTNNISLVDILEQLTANVNIKDPKNELKEINVPINFEVVSFWLKDSAEKVVKANLEIEIIDPEGKVLKKFPQTLEFPPNIRRLRSRLRILGFVLTVSGNYVFKVKIKDEKRKEYQDVAELPLEVNLKKEYTNTKTNLN